MSESRSPAPNHDVVLSFEFPTCLDSNAAVNSRELQATSSISDRLASTDDITDSLRLLHDALFDILELLQQLRDFFVEVAILGPVELLRLSAVWTTWTFQSILGQRDDGLICDLLFTSPDVLAIFETPVYEHAAGVAESEVDGGRHVSLQADHEVEALELRWLLADVELVLALVLLLSKSLVESGIVSVSEG
jgi:hypothetical protein